jgi:A/G-specific adenine glycosylase
MPLPTIPSLPKFKKIVWDYYHEHRRIFAWRKTTDPYAILVSEIMLQQTQTDRVAKKFSEFLKTFPTFKNLAQAPLADVLRAWQGLGYNRRAIALQKIAVRVLSEFGGHLPNNPEMLETFPGIGQNTAGSICAFAFNEPTVFIETNIRTVFLHHFFPEVDEVHDRQLLPLIEQTLDHKNPREWYYALMDYGVHLKKLHKNPSRRSAHHAKQSKFVGSDRQVRGAILRLLLVQNTLSFEELHHEFPHHETERLERIVQELIREHFIIQKDEQYLLR